MFCYLIKHISCLQPQSLLRCFFVTSPQELLLFKQSESWHVFLFRTRLDKQTFRNKHCLFVVSDSITIHFFNNSNKKKLNNEKNHYSHSQEPNFSDHNSDHNRKKIPMISELSIWYKIVQTS